MKEKDGPGYNGSMLPNVYLDSLMSLLRPYEFVVLSYAVRRIVGFHKASDQISLSQFVGGVVSRKTGERLDGGTGLNVRTVKKALAALKQYGVLVELASYDVHTKRAACYALQLDLTKIDLAGLEARQAQVWRQRRGVTAQGEDEDDEDGDDTGVHEVGCSGQCYAVWERDDLAYTNEAVCDDPTIVKGNIVGNIETTTTTQACAVAAAAVESRTLGLHTSGGTEEQLL